MTRKQKIALYGGLIAVPLSIFAFSYFIKRIRYLKLVKMIDPLSGGKDLKDIPDDPDVNKAFDIYYHQGGTIPHRNYWKSPNNKVMQWRDTIYNAGHSGTGWGTNDTEIEGAFRAMPDKVAVSQVADSYQRRYEMDLYADLLSELEDSPQVSKRLFTQVKALPDYTTY